MTANISRSAITIILSALMVLIDMTVANVALPDMMGTLGATSTQITWVRPVTAWQKRFVFPWPPG